MPSLKTPKRSSTLLRILLGAIFSFVLGVSLYSWAVGHTHGPESFLPSVDLCPFHALTDLRCAGCGISRAFLSVGMGQFHRAWEWNPLVFIVFPSFLGWFLWPLLPKTWQSWLRSLWLRYSLRWSFYPILLGGVVVFWIFRVAHDLKFW